MKTKILSLVSVFLLGTSMVFAQAKTEKFEVKGNCGMCEKRIEKAAKTVEGVSLADWNKENKMLELSFDESKTTLHKVQMVIAKAGHDTPMHKAKDEVYNKLPDCCKYDRSETKKEMKGHEGHKH
ncbi:heavy-metal-associated domain-containing protein [Roseimarinus sediminis]|uniref:heavy-metal-associated domain-containing protein n=1 Tax=Roseimarinus sediminis TaxID=1610899 RepID=UPI003D198AFD